jgi:hypothetical protein
VSDIECRCLSLVEYMRAELGGSRPHPCPVHEPEEWAKAEEEGRAAEPEPVTTKAVAAWALAGMPLNEDSGRIASALGMNVVTPTDLDHKPLDA